MDEEQQRALQQHDRSLRPTASTALVLSNGGRRGSFGATSQGSSMTPKSDPPREPRTNFTSSRQQPSLASSNGYGFASASPRTNFTSGTGTAGGGQAPLQIETGIRISDGVVSSSDETNRRDGSIPTNQYAGTSSGLKISVTLMIVGIAVGIALGIGLNLMDVSPLAARWIGLPGELFLRAMKCLVIPYVFCSVAVAIGDIVFVGKVSVVGLQTAKIFVVSWICTCTMGTALAMAFRPLFRGKAEFLASESSSVGFTCVNGRRMEMLQNGTLACSSTEGGMGQTTSFILKDINDVFAKNAKVLPELDLSQQLMSMVQSIISSNIAQSMAKADLLAIITFAMLFGVIAGRNFFTKTRRVNYLYLVLLQLRNTFFLAMEWVIWLTPVAVISIIAGSFANNKESFDRLDEVYMYVVAGLCGTLITILILMPAIIFLLTRCNPYNHMRPMIRAYMFAFGAASSLATAPVTLGCLKKARCCSQSLANFIISIGVTSNMSGSGWYYPVAVVFLAESSGHGDDITPVRIIAIFGLSLLACAGTAPIPSSGLVMISTIYKTVFAVNEMPSTFPLVVAVDFFVDRLSTVCNVNDDIMALKLIAENTDETIANELLGERY